MIMLYVYSIESGLFMYEYTGKPEHTNNGILEGCDFTLTKPPNYSQQWYWYDNAWQAEPKPTP